MELVKVSEYRKFVAVESAREFDAPSEMLKATDDVAAVARQMIPDDGQEHLFVCALDAHGKPLAVGVVATGTVDMCPLYPRDVYAWALTHAGVRFVGVAHNHPSGDVTPSGPDKKGSAVVAQGGKMLGVDLVWSLVVTHLSREWAEVPLEGKRPNPQGDDAEPKRPEDEDESEPDGSPEESPEGEPEAESEPEEPSEDGSEDEQEAPEDAPEQEPEESGVEYPEDAPRGEQANNTPSDVSVDDLRAAVRKAFGIK